MRNVREKPSSSTARVTSKVPGGRAVVALLDLRPRAVEALHRDLGQVAAAAQRGIEREADLVPGREVAVRPPLAQLAALHEPVVAEVVRGPIAPHRFQRRLVQARQPRVLVEDGVEGDLAPEVGLAPHAEVPGQRVGQLVARLLVEEVGEPDRGRGEGMRRAPHAALPEPLAEVAVDEREAARAARPRRGRPARSSPPRPASRRGSRITSSSAASVRSTTGVHAA